MARPTMQELIARLARLVDDVAHDVWTQDEKQTALDANRIEARYLRLNAVPTRSAGPSGVITEYKIFEAPWSDWEGGASFFDNDYTAITPSVDDYQAGRWEFAAEPERPVRLLGYTYDLYAAAANLLEERAAAAAEDVQSFAVPGGTISYSPKQAAWLRQAHRYRSRQRPEQTRIGRADAYGDAGAPR